MTQGQPFASAPQERWHLDKGLGWKSPRGPRWVMRHGRLPGGGGKGAAVTGPCVQCIRLSTTVAHDNTDSDHDNGTNSSVVLTRLQSTVTNGHSVLAGGKPQARGEWPPQARHVPPARPGQERYLGTLMPGALEAGTEVSPWATGSGSCSQRGAWTQSLVLLLRPGDQLRDSQRPVQNESVGPCVNIKNFNPAAAEPRTQCRPF